MTFIQFILSDRKEFIGVAFFTALQSGVKLIVNFIIGKMAAVYLGPVGLGLLGQFQNLANLFQNFSNGAIQNGVIKHIAQEKNIEEQKKITQTAFTISLIIGFLFFIAVVLFSSFLNNSFVKLENYFYPFLFLGLSCLFFSLNTLITSLFNATKDFKSLSYFNISQSIITLLLFIPLTFLGKLNGALIAVVSFNVLSFFVGFFMLRNKRLQFAKSFIWGIDKRIVKNLAAFSLMTLVTVFNSSVTQLSVRTFIINHISKIDAGFWEALNRISNFYIFFLALIFSSYILPKYAEERNSIGMKNQIFSNFYRILPLTIFILGVVFLLKDVLVQFIFTKEFLPLKEFMPYHLLGDFFKISAWVLSNFLVAQKRVFSFIISDIVFNLSFVLMVYFLGKNLNDITFYYMLSGILYLVFLLPQTYFTLNKISTIEQN
ncbi:MAG: O-antigen translocase [Chitinophagaceae bacterium]|nr:O-antigen translocase [Chitinophagaceae bacterium]